MNIQIYTDALDALAGRCRGQGGGRSSSSDATADNGEGNDNTLRNRVSTTNSAGSLRETMTFSVESNDKKQKWSTEEKHELMFNKRTYTKYIIVHYYSQIYYYVYILYITLSFGFTVVV